jgi:hypothetical protein
MCGLYFTYFPDFVSWVMRNLYNLTTPPEFNTLTSALWRFEGTIFSLIWISNSNTITSILEAWDIIVNGRDFQEEARTRSRMEEGHGSNKGVDSSNRNSFIRAGSINDGVNNDSGSAPGLHHRSSLVFKVRGRSQSDVRESISLQPRPSLLMTQKSVSGNDGSSTSEQVEVELIEKVQNSEVMSMNR